MTSSRANARFPAVRLALHLDRCALTYSKGACRADPSKLQCFNTFATCRAEADYTLDNPAIHRFASINSRIVSDLGESNLAFWRPLITAWSLSPAALKPDYKLWARETASITLADIEQVDDDIDDKYGRRINAGLYFARFFSRNRHFLGRRAVFEIGEFDADGVFYALSTHDLIVDKVKYSGKAITFALRDAARISDKAGALCPKPQSCKLTALASATTNIIYIDDCVGLGVLDIIAVDKEAMKITGVVSTNGRAALIDVERAQWKSEAVEHSIGVAVQKCFFAEAEKLSTLIARIIRDYAVSETALADDFFADSILANPRVTGILAKPLAVDKLLDELQRQFLFSVWFDSSIRRWRIRASGGDIGIVGEEGRRKLNDSHFIRNSLRQSVNPRGAVSRVRVFANPAKPVERSTNEIDYTQIIALNADIESKNARGTSTEVKIFARWLNEAQAAETAAAYLAAGALDEEILEFSSAWDSAVAGVKEGDQIEIRSQRFIDGYGVDRVISALVLRARPLLDKIEVQALSIFDGAFSIFRLNISKLDSPDILL